jgi:hypothetical protein
MKRRYSSASISRATKLLGRMAWAYGHGSCPSEEARLVECETVTPVPPPAADCAVAPPEIAIATATPVMRVSNDCRIFIFDLSDFLGVTAFVKVELS